MVILTGTRTPMVDGPQLTVQIHVLQLLVVQIKTGLVAPMMTGTVTATLTRLVITGLHGM